MRVQLLITTDPDTAKRLQRLADTLERVASADDGPSRALTIRLAKLDVRSLAEHLRDLIDHLPDLDRRDEETDAVPLLSAHPVEPPPLPKP